MDREDIWNDAVEPFIKESLRRVKLYHNLVIIMNVGLWAIIALFQFVIPRGPWSLFVFGFSYPLCGYFLLTLVDIGKYYLHQRWLEKVTIDNMFVFEYHPSVYHGVQYPKNTTSQFTEFLKDLEAQILPLGVPNAIFFPLKFQGRYLTYEYTGHHNLFNLMPKNFLTNNDRNLDYVGLLSWFNLMIEPINERNYQIEWDKFRNSNKTIEQWENESRKFSGIGIFRDPTEAVVYKLTNF